MKKASQIISHLKTKPYLKNLQHVDCYNQLLSLLPKNLRDNTKFVYQKNSTLFFVLSHPGIKMEFNYKSNLIKSILKKLIEVNPKCIFMQSSHIKAFVTNKMEPKNRKSRKFYYKERAEGKFANSISDTNLHEIVENIREYIRKNREDELRRRP